MGSTRRRFTDEYRRYALRLVLDSGDTVAEIARSIGVHEMTLGKWMKKERDDGEESARLLDEDERAELERLRKEVDRLRLEAEFAKKVAARFAKDQQRSSLPSRTGPRTTSSPSTSGAQSLRCPAPGTARNASGRSATAP